MITDTEYRQGKSNIKIIDIPKEKKQMVKQKVLKDLMTKREDLIHQKIFPRKIKV